MTFDVGKGVFRLEVEVRKEDGLWLGKKMKRGEGKADVSVVPVDDLSDEGIGSRGCQVDEEDPQRREDEEGLATEIYIPLVHYAHPKVLEGSWMAGGGGGKNRSDAQSVLSLGARRKRAVSDATMAAATTSMASPAISSSSSSSSLPSTSTLTYPPNQTHNTNTNTNKNPKHYHSRIINQSMDSAPDLVDVQVEVSGGKWSVCGQTLKWRYDVPPSSSCGSTSKRSGSSKSDSDLGDEGDEEAVKKYTIEIKRRGGPVNIGYNERGGWNSGLVVGERGRERKGGKEWCKEICDLGACLIM